MNKLFTIYIGLERTAKGDALDQGENFERIILVKSTLAAQFGGYSLGEVSGGYTGQDGKLAEERAIRIELTASDAQAPAIRACAAQFRDLFMQESVLLNSTVIESNFI